MTTAVQHRRGTTAEHSTFTGLEGEVTIDTTKDTAVIHDGVLAGGYPLAKENLANVTTSGLASIDGASTASDDKFFIYDQSATTLKTITRAELNNAMEQDALANVAITGGTINGTSIGATTASSGAFTTLSASSSVTLSGGTANGVAYLNGSKVLTTGSALTFDGSTLNVTRPSTEGLVLELDSAGASTRTLEISSFTNSVAGAGWRFNASSSAGVLAFSTNSTEGMRLTSTGLGIGTSSPTNALSVSGNANITGNVTLGDASTDTVTVNGYMSVGGAASSSIGVYLRSSALGSVDQIGYQSALRGTSAATTFIRGFSAFVGTEAASFTVANLAGYSASDASKGAGSTITNQHGLYIADQTQGTNNYGITSLVSSGTNKWNIYASGTAKNLFAGQVVMTNNTTTEGSLYLQSTAPVIGFTDTNSFTDPADVALIRAGTNNLQHQYYDASTTTTYDLMSQSLTETVFNDSSQDIDFRVESDTNTHALFVEGSSGNVGIGTSSPESQLHIYQPSGQTGFRITRSSTLAAGASLSLTVDSAGARVNGYGNLQFYTAAIGGTAAERLRIDSSGNVGIGTAASDSAWASTKVVNIGRLGNSVFGTTNDDEINIGANVINTGSGTYIYGATDTASLYRQVAAQHVWYYAGSGTAGAALTLTEAMRINASGNVGIGTSSPSAVGSRTTVNVAGTAGAALRLSDDTANMFLDYTDGTGGRLSVNAGEPLTFSTNSLERLRIDSSGNVGIGTSSPSQRLDVWSGTASSAVAQFTGVNGGRGLKISTALVNSVNDAGVILDAQQASGVLMLATAGTERLRIDSSGNLLVGTTSAGGQAGLSILPNNSNGAATLFWDRASTSSTSTALNFENGNATVGSVTYTNTGTAYNTSSDYRLKEDISPMTGALAKVAALKPCTYKWKADGSDGEGFIAHELAEVVPQAVTGEKDAVDADGNPVYQGIDTSFLVATLTAAIQEQQAIINQLKARLDAANL